MSQPPDDDKKIGSEAVPSNNGASTSTAPEDEKLSNEELLKEFFSELRDVDRDNEVNRILWSFKLNPFERMNLRFTATAEEIRKQYRKLSLLVHPDKCKHPQASAAFEILGQAQKDLMDEERRAELQVPLDMAREQVRTERKKETKHDTAVRLASLLHEKGREGIEEEYEQSDEFHERWRVKARELLTNTEWRRRKLVKRIKSEEERVKEEIADDRDRAKKLKQHEQQWETSRDTRVGTWRDFQTKSKGKKAVGELKPVKLKTNDEEKLYVQRPVGEQFRPPPPKGAKKNPGQGGGGHPQHHQQRR